MRIRLNPLYLLVLALAALGLTVVFQNKVDTRSDELRGATSAYAAAITTARFDLASLTRKIATDRTLLQNLNWNLAHSVKGAMAGRLTQGKLDQAMIADDKCKVIAQVHESGATPLECPHANGKLRLPAEGYAWIRGKAGATLVYVTPLIEAADSASRDLYAIGAVQIDNAWLGSLPTLRNHLAAARLEMSEESSGAIYREGIAEDGTALASLVSSSALDRQLTAQLHGGKPANSLLWPSLVLAFVLTIFAAVREKVAQRSQHNALESFFDWCKKLAVAEGVDTPEEATGKKRPSLLTSSQTLIERVQKSHKDVVRGFNAKVSALETQVVTQTEQISKLQTRLAELAELDSLAVQLQRTTAGFLQRMGQLQQHAEHLSDLVTSGMTRDARRLANVLKDWRAGIAARGVRKFLRSLSETEGSEPGSNQLEEQLLTMVELTSHIDDQSINASLTCGSLGRESAYAARIAGFWHGLALKTNDEKPCTALPGAIEEALGLAKLDRLTSGMSFTALQGDQESAKLLQTIAPPLPQRALASALYHVYLAMADVLRGQKQGVIASRVRFEASKAMLIVSGTTADGKNAPQRTDGQAYHLEIARSILAPFKLGVSALPVMSGPYPIAITWTAVEGARAQTERSGATGGKVQLPMPQKKNEAEKSSASSETSLT